MCLILFSYQAHPEYPLIIAANRDEFYKRPTKDLYLWPDSPHILAGQDAQEGGTWLGITSNGRFSALTNVRETTSPNEVKSRGHLVVDFLRDNCSPETYLREVAKNHHLFKGFNLLVGDNQALFYYSNREHRIRELAPGFYGLSNHLLNTPWPKVTRGLTLFKSIVAENLSDTALLSLLENDNIAADHLLPDTGIGMDSERLLSPLFIKSEVYGTRSSAVILKERTGNIRFTEKRFGPQGIRLGSSSMVIHP